MSEFKPIETQEQLDAIISDRIKRAQETTRKEFEGFLSPEDAAKKYSGYLSPEDEKKKYAGYLSPESRVTRPTRLKCGLPMRITSLMNLQAGCRVNPKKISGKMQSLWRNY